MDAGALKSRVNEVWDSISISPHPQLIQFANDHPRVCEGVAITSFMTLAMIGTVAWVFLAGYGINHMEKNGYFGEEAAEYRRRMGY